MNCTNLVFSYGTLTEKFPSAPSEKATLTCMCELDTYHIYPALVKSNQMNKIPGDAIQLTDEELKQADIYEDHPHLYERVEKEIVFDDGSSAKAWIYFFKNKTN